LQVECKDGIVTLSGPVDTEKVKARAERLAKKVKGVKQVVNNITIKERTRTGTNQSRSRPCRWLSVGSSNRR